MVVAQDNTVLGSGESFELLYEGSGRATLNTGIKAADAKEIIVSTYIPEAKVYWYMMRASIENGVLVPSDTFPIYYSNCAQIIIDNDGYLVVQNLNAYGYSTAVYVLIYG